MRNVFEETYNPDGDFLIEIDGVRSVRPAKELDVSFHVVDDDNEFTSIIEARLPGTDTIVHRGVDIKLKRGLSMGALLGGTS